MSSLPDFYPDWAQELAEIYLAGSTCLFVLHGNVHDLVPAPSEEPGEFCSVLDFLAYGLFGEWEVVLRYDLSQGLQPMVDGDEDRLREMVRLTSRSLGERLKWPHAPDNVLPGIHGIVDRNLLEMNPEHQLKLAFLFPYAQYLVPSTGLESLTGQQATRLVRLLEWAQNPYIKQHSVAFCLLAEKLTEVNSRLLNSPHVATVEVPLPDEPTRSNFVSSHPKHKGGKRVAAQLARLSNGLNLTSLDRMLRRQEQGEPLEVGPLKALKKQLIERQCNGLLEFLEPSHTLDIVVGHTAAKKRLKEDAKLLKQGHLEAAPMGYLICGSVGTGKTFLSECYAGTIGIPCVKLKNFRSKYVGETEGNLEHVLNVLRSLGPVMVIIDEADAALGNRDAEGDSGTSGRVFSMIASQMGNTDYRGKILWMLLTCRPDLLPIDLKRQGRAEVHIPLFYPQGQEEREQMFQVMARKNQTTLEDDALPVIPAELELSGADIESIVITARRKALLAKRDSISRKNLKTAVDSFLPSVQGLEKELQEIAAVLECTQLDFLTDHWRKLVTQPQGRAKLQNRMLAIQRSL